MSVEESIAAAKKKKLRVANLYEGTDGVWRCFLYRKPTESPTNWLSGTGAGPVEAIEAALAKPIEAAADRLIEPVKLATETMFEDLLG